MALRKKAENPARVIVIVRDFDEFDLLAEELDVEFEDAWTSMDLEAGKAAIERGMASELKYLVLAVNRGDEQNLEDVLKIAKAARDAGLPLLVVANDLSPMGLHQIMRSGADEFAPYPLPDGVLRDTMERLDAKDKSTESGESRRKRKGLILPVYGVAGGVGATTFAVNLAWEMALHAKKSDLRVALLDFNFQYGSVSTYLDLARREAIYELISEPSTLDHDSLSQALTSYKKRLAVLTAPTDALPLDIIGAEDVGKLLEIASASYDFVIIDMPQALVHWSDHVLQMSETFFAVMEVDMRSAQNMLRFLRTLKAEELPWEKVHFVLNRAPGFTDLNGKSRVKRLAESLGIDINIYLPDGGKAVINACDQGFPLAEASSNNALRKEVRKVAVSLVEMAQAQKAAIA